jgi:hypothetical protein
MFDAFETIETFLVRSSFESTAMFVVAVIGGVSVSSATSLSSSFSSA